MKRLMVLILGVILMSGLVYARDNVMTKKAGDYNVEVRLDKNPPVVGNNKMEIELTDASGRPVTDAKVIVNYSMPPMPGMPAANYKAIALLTGTKYAATLNLSMSGPWNIAVKIIKGGKTSGIKLNIDAQ